ncbi:aminotransferase class III-fold pyridoxal phosphate-dependent enzyme [Erythrobacter sp.]|uniref:aminotransferase family protein n=1 Tax=Erythrobacter sp. TaxID=1042 RepID=UPI001B02BC5D|nr:aminotransferase class III-fold pyridoxal phosphate-dependent enzyme [Erythrobacter sp.]MBO6527553.1 aminotransferase class III-fold pyridoxal phosphate-dependent enzyme [Erythrobacter sp.]MBO6530233.1 aminotransferase class III-fold pyridoxal phosphate-dependent enzyme [Erythrobacter sp.]
MTDAGYITALDKRHHLHPMSNPGELSRDGALLMARGDGCYLFDGEGKRYFDAIAGLCSVPIGYGNRHVARAVADQMRDLSYYHAFFHMGTEPAAYLSRRLCELCPDGYEHFLYQSSGSEAVEASVKLAWLYHRTRGNPGKRCIIARRRSYHGNTIFATRLTGIDDYREGFGLAGGAEDVVQIGSPFAWEHGCDNDARFGAEAAGWLDQTVAQLGADTVAAFIAEPVQGTGGCIIPPDTYWQEIRRICSKHDILLICDEVMTGFGRLGHWFGQQAFDYRGDIMCLSKGITSSYIPLAAVALQTRIFEALASSGVDFAHGQTCSAHPVACAAAIANLEVIEREGLVGGAARLGPFLHTQLERRLAGNPVVGEVRSRGMMLAVQLDDRKLGEEAASALAGRACELLLEGGVIARSSHCVLLVSPPLIATEVELSDLAEAVTRALERVGSA